MQFMEPLGTTDASVEAAWDFTRNRWRPEVVDAIKALGPSSIRWGGIYASYWKWREGVGPRDQRVPSVNYLWGGIESNQVGLHEYLDLCKQVEAEPLICVNFESDGRPEYRSTLLGEDRAGTAEDAADLVSYCNDPSHPERKQNGMPSPWGVKLWQIGNETSYPRAGRRMTRRENAERYRVFATEMRRRDPSIELIGWGDKNAYGEPWWAEDLLHVAGDLVDYVGIHMMQQSPRRPDTVLRGLEYAKDREQAWEELLEIYQTLEPRLLEVEGLLAGKGTRAKIAITEGHLSLQPHNACPILTEWISALYHAKVFNLYQRHGDWVQIATLADFFGNRWTVNAVMVGGPHQKPFLMPVGIVLSLFRNNVGEKAVAVNNPSTSLDVTGSRTGENVYLHVVNGDLKRPVDVDIAVRGMEIEECSAWQLAPGSLATYVGHECPDAIQPVKVDIAAGRTVRHTFPAASVSTVEMKVVSAGSMKATPVSRMRPSAAPRNSATL